jgi:hypothetical protein
MSFPVTRSYRDEHHVFNTLWQQCEEKAEVCDVTIKLDGGEVGKLTQNILEYTDCVLTSLYYSSGSCRHVNIGKSHQEKPRFAGSCNIYMLIEATTTIEN